MTIARALKVTVRAVSVILGIFGILIGVMAAAFLRGAGGVDISDLLFFLPYAAISAILFWNAVLVFRNWSEKAIGLFSAVVSVSCASTIVNYFRDILDSALESGETFVISGIAFVAIALFMTLFLILKIGLTKHTLVEQNATN